MVERSILIGSLSAPNFTVKTAKMDRSRTDLADLCFCKDIQKQYFCLKKRPFPRFLTKQFGGTSAKMAYRNKYLMFSFYSSARLTIKCALLSRNSK